MSAPIIDRPRADGWVIVAIREVARGGTDPDVLALAVQSGAVLLTEAKDFGDLVYRERLPHRGVVLIRVDDVRRDERPEVVSRAVRRHHAESPNAFAVLTPAGVRIRRPVPDADGTNETASG